MNLPRNILILSAAPEQWEMVCDLLSKRGITARCIGEPYHFVAAFAGEPTEAVLLDIEDFRKQDVEILRVIRQLRPETGIVAVIDRDQRDVASVLLMSGADLYLLKPAAAPEIMEALERADRRRQLMQAGPKDARKSDALATFAVGVTQKINDALAIMKMSLQMLQQDLGPGATAEKLNPVNDEIDRVANVCRLLLTFSRQRAPGSEKVDLTRIIGELARIYTAHCRERGIELTSEIDENCPSVAGDEAQLRQACDAILEQAVAALSSQSTEGRRISINCRPKDDGVEVTFEDNGPMIPSQVLEQIFDPLRAGRREGGKEMGLALAAGIVESHGGRMRAESNDTPLTRFIMWLPATKEQA